MEARCWTNRCRNWHFRYCFFFFLLPSSSFFVYSRGNPFFFAYAEFISTGRCFFCSSISSTTSSFARMCQHAIEPSYERPRTQIEHRQMCVCSHFNGNAKWTMFMGQRIRMLNGMSLPRHRSHVVDKSLLANAQWRRRHRRGWHTRTHRRDQQQQQQQKDR